MLEFALVFMVFITIVFGMIEFSIAVFRYNLVSQMARHAARQAIVHGELAPPKMAVWGPTAYSATTLGTANANDEIAGSLLHYSSGINLKKTKVAVRWLDGNTAINSRVEVTVTTEHDPFVSSLFLSKAITFRAQSVMQIAH